MTYIALYVDDLVITGTCIKSINELKFLLSSKWKIKDLGLVSNCLGLEIKMIKETKITTIIQTKYIKDMLELFNMQKCNPSLLPMDPSCQLTICLLLTTQNQ